MHDQVQDLFGLSGLDNVSFVVDDHLVYVEGELAAPKNCPRCGHTHLHRKAKNHRLLKLPPVGHRETKLQVVIQKQRCVDCKHQWAPSTPFTKGKERMSQSFVQYALELLRFGTIKDVAEHLRVSWDTIKDIHKEHLEETYEKIDLSEIEFLSIDEFSIAKGHKYMTVVLDLSSGRIVHAVEGRKKEDLAPFLKKLKKKHTACELFA